MTVGSADLSMYDDATVAEVESALTGILGQPLADALGPAYGDVEQMVVETLIGVDHPDHDAIIATLGREHGPERASLMVLGMTLLVQAQGRGVPVAVTPGPEQDGHDLPSPTRSPHPTPPFSMPCGWSGWDFNNHRLIHERRGENPICQARGEQ